jgi:hypothetical protein
MIIKSKKIIYPLILYGDNTHEEFQCYKYLGIIFICYLDWNDNVENIIIGGLKAYYGFKNKCRNAKLSDWDKKKIIFKTLVILIILNGCKFWTHDISYEAWSKIEQIQKHFKVYNFKTKCNTPYSIL